MPFDFTSAIRAVCVDMTQRLELLSHIDMNQVAVGYRQTRRAVQHGLQASLTPLRFEMGAETGKVGRHQYICPRLLDGQGNECLYLLNFYLPRLLEHPLEEKLTTITHELWHIGPNMDGDLRRHEGRCYAHGNSQKEFDEHAAELARQWLDADPPSGLYGFLESTFEELVHEHGSVVGDRYAVPKLKRLGLAG